ncbi:MAG TPA: YceI family protein [Longimicrobiales bacterium]
MESRAAALTILGLMLAAAPSVAQRTPVALQPDVAASRIYVVTHRTGLLSFLGHEHAILAQKWTADLCWDEAGQQSSRAKLVIEAGSLDIDADSTRTLAGIGKGPSPQQRTQIHNKLHNEQNLSTRRYPEIRFASSLITDEGAGKLKARGTLTIRETSREVEMPVTWQRLSTGDLAFTGTLTFRQSSFGIRPESIAGVVKVADPVDLYVRLIATPVDRGCQGPRP